MKALAVLALIVFLASCSKDEDLDTANKEEAFFRVEAVNSSGESSYSPVTVTR